MQLKASITPSDAANKKVIWKTNKPAVAKVNSSGKVTAVAKGKATITVTTVDGSYSAKCVITVKVPVTKVTLNKTKRTLVKGKASRLKATVFPADASNTKVTWKSSKPKVVKVTNTGKIVALKKGEYSGLKRPGYRGCGTIVPRQ